MEKSIKTLKNSEKAITLIALVITIIVLLILAGISISMLSGDNSILSRAGESRDKTSESQKDEEVKIAVLGSYGNNGSLDIERLLTNLNAIDDITVTPTQEDGINTFPVTVTTEYTSYEITSDGNFEEVQIADRTRLKIGDYVNYSYVGGSTTLDNVVAGVGTYSNFRLTTPTAIPQTITAKTGLKWRILNINDDGSVDLTCYDPNASSNKGLGTTGTVTFQGARGYNNGVVVLNNLCRGLFAPNTTDSNIAKNSGKITVRSMTIEDVEKHFTDATLNGTKVYGYTYLGIKYGGNGNVAIETDTTTKKYTGNYRKYPKIYEQEKYSGISISSSETVKSTGYDQSDEIYKTPTTTDEWLEADSTNGLTITQTYYKGSFSTSETKNSNTDDGTDVYSVIFNSGYYWLASRYVDCSDGTAAANFGLRVVNGTYVSKDYLFNNYGSTNPGAPSRALRPIVSLGSSVKLEDSETKEGIYTVWDIK